MTRILFWGMILAYPLFICATEDHDLANWKDVKYQAANTAEKCTWLTQEEKEIYYYVNLARMFPSRFADVYLKDEEGNPPDSGNERSLYEDLKKMKPLGALQPDQTLSMTAECWAIEAGKDGIIGHDRKNCTDNYFSECCDYGNSTGLEIVLDLLIDEDVPSLGHRYICLSSAKVLGVAIRPHKTYQVNAVLDFK